MEITSLWKDSHREHTMINRRNPRKRSKVSEVLTLTTVARTCMQKEFSNVIVF